MHKKLLNHASLAVVLRPRGPILIKSGVETSDPTRPGMEFVRTRHHELGETVYLPGTGLKGAIRSHAERVLRGLRVDACNPFGGQGCKKPQPQFKGDEVTPDRIFKAQCATCRTFGSLNLSGRAHVLDAYPWSCDSEAAGRASSEVRTESRWQVGINRRSGQTQPGALFELEVVVGGAFQTEVQFRNFQLWQLGLVAAVLRDMDEGHVPIGFGKSRGLGQVAVELGELTVETASPDAAKLLGTAALCEPGERDGYDLHPDDAVDLPSGLEAERTWRGRRLTVAREVRDRLLEAIVDGPLASFVEAWQKRQAAGGGR